MNFNTLRRYERELVSVADDFYTVSLRRLQLGEDNLPQVAAPPAPDRRWGETIPDLVVDEQIKLRYPEDAIPVGLAVSGLALTLMMEENTEERRRCDRQIWLEDVKDKTKVKLSVPNSAAPGDTTEVEVEIIHGSNSVEAIIRERRAGKLLTEMQFVRFPGSCNKCYLEIMEFGSL